VDDDGWLATHEAGHSVMATLWPGWTLRGVTISGGTYSAGCARVVPPLIPAAACALVDFATPFDSWPEVVRRFCEARYVISAAGTLAEVMLAPFGSQRPLAIAPAAALPPADLPPLEAADAAALIAVVNSDGDDDLTTIAKVSRFAYGTDLDARNAWAAHMEIVTEGLILANREAIERLAAVLGQLRSMSGEAAAAVIRDTQ
jgi:hypothetical protein